MCVRKEMRFMKLSEINFNDLDEELIDNIFFSVKKKEYDYADYLIIYGCHVKELLEKRLNYALKVIKNKSIDKIVLTGGIGIKGDFNESSYMYNYLVKNGINKQKIIIENNSTTTEENNINVINMLNLKNIQRPLSIVFVTQEIHMLRIMLHWKKLMNNSFIKLYYDFVEEERISLNDEVIDGLTLSTLINEQLDKIKSFIKDGTYIDIDVSEIKNSF